MKYVFYVKNIQAIAPSPFRDFLNKNQDDPFIQYSIVSMYKGHDSSTQYIDRIQVTAHLPEPFTTHFTLNPSQFIELNLWKTLFRPQDEYVRDSICNKRYHLRKSNATGKYNVTTQTVKNLFVRNTIWKLAAHGINTGDKEKQPSVIPLTVRNGRITRLAIVKPGCQIPEEICYNDWRTAPSVTAFLDIYELEKVEVKEFLTAETAKEIRKKSLELQQLFSSLVTNATNWATQVRFKNASEEFNTLIEGLVK